MQSHTKIRVKLIHLVIFINIFVHSLSVLYYGSEKRFKVCTSFILAPFELATSIILA